MTGDRDPHWNTDPAVWDRLHRAMQMEKRTRGMESHQAWVAEVQRIQKEIG